MQKTSSEQQVGFRLARIDEDFYLDRYAEDASTKDYTTTIYQVPSLHTEDEVIGISDNKGYLKLFNIQQNEYAIYKLFVESEGDIIPLNTPWKQFKFISNNQLSTPRTYKSRILFENEEDEPPCYHGCPAYKICFLQQNSNKMFYSVVHFGKTYYENDSLFARSTHVFGCAQHQDQITCFDMENNYLVTGSINGDLKVWIHREESVEMNQDESFELAWTLKGVHKKQFLQKVAIVIPTSGYSKNPFIVSGGGQDGILLIHDIENQQLLQQIILESSPLSLMRDFLPSSSLIACNQLGTVYLYEESEDVYSKTVLNLQIAYYIISDQPNITVNSVTCFFMNNDVVNVFSVSFRDKNNRIISNSMQFYIGQLLVMEYSFETPILFCTVFSMKKDNRINVKSSIPLPGSHLVACDKDGRGHVWLIDEIISQIIKKDQQENHYDEYPLEQPEQPEESYQNMSFSLETPRPQSVPKQMQSYYSPHEEKDHAQELTEEEQQPNTIDYSSDEDLLSDVTSVMSSLSSISLPREIRNVPKPTKSPSTDNMDPTIPQTMDQMLWSQEFTPNKPQDDRIDLNDIDRNRDMLTPEPQVIKIRKTKSPPKQSSPILKTHSLPEFNKQSPSLDEELIQTPQITESLPKPVIRREKEIPKPVIIDDVIASQSPVNASKPLRKRIKPETTRVNSGSNLQIEVLVPKKPKPSSLKKSSSSNQVKIVNHFSDAETEPTQNTEPEYDIPQHTPAIIPNSSRRIEYKLHQKQSEEFNEQTARQVLKENSLFNKNDAEKVLNYTPGESMFGNIVEKQDVAEKNYDIVETKLKKQVSKKHLKEIKQRPSIMDLYVKEDWEKEITLEQTGPRTIYTLSFDQFDDVLPHPKGEYDSIRKFLKENPII